MFTLVLQKPAEGAQVNSLSGINSVILIHTQEFVQFKTAHEICKPETFIYEMQTWKFHILEQAMGMIWSCNSETRDMQM